MTPHNFSDIALDLGNISVPCYGFRDQNFHLLITTPDGDNRLKQFLVTRFGMTGLEVLTKLAANSSREIGYAVLQNTTIPDTLFETITGVASIVFPFWKIKQALSLENYLCSFMLFGVQPKRFKGFTFYRNKILESDQDSLMHYALSGNEFIGFGLPIHAAKEGKVVEVVSNVNDSVRGWVNSNFELGNNVMDAVGNYVRIQHSAIVDTIYGSLMQYSPCVRVGDTVKKGQIIGKMGCSAKWSNIPFLYFQVAYTGPKLPIMGLTHVGFLPSMVKWDSFMYCDVLKLPIFGADEDRTNPNTFSNIDTRRLEYQYGTRTITDFILVKKFPIILSE